MGSEMCIRDRLITQLTLQHLHDLRERSESDDGLVDPRDATAISKTSLGEMVPNEDAARVRCSAALTMGGKTFYAGDLAFARVRGRIVLLEIWYHVRFCDGRIRSCVSEYDPAPSANDSKLCKTFRRKQSPRLEHDSCFVASAIYMMHEGYVAALVPWCLRD